MEPRRAAAATRPESESESRRRRQDAAADTRWLETLSEPELVRRYDWIGLDLSHGWRIKIIQTNLPAY
jgi:hypothetical protein